MGAGASRTLHTSWEGGAWREETEVGGDLVGPGVLRGRGGVSPGAPEGLREGAVFIIFGHVFSK